MNTNIVKFCCLTIALAVTQVGTAGADVERLDVRFGGGCKAENTGGSCTIRSTSSGTDLDTESAVLFTAAKPGEPLKRFSPRVKSFDANGRVSFRLKNIPGGCFQVRTAENGNDKPDHKSRVVCE